MPNRVLREGLRTSERVAGLSDEGFRLFTLMITVADDYGRFDGDARLIKSACYPYDSHPLSDVSNALSEVCQAGLLITYTVNAKAYVQFEIWEQRKRCNKSKYPDPPAVICPSHDSHMSPEERGSGSEDRGIEERGAGEVESTPAASTQPPKHSSTSELEAYRFRNDLIEINPSFKSLTPDQVALQIHNAQGCNLDEVIKYMSLTYPGADIKVPARTLQNCLEKSVRQQERKRHEI